MSDKGYVYRPGWRLSGLWLRFRCWVRDHVAKPDLCSTCGFTRGDHDVEIPEDWYVDPGAYPCDSFTRD